ncbi:MAG: hypothetical protein ABGX05_03480 [Pirellulaceae bacterium]
MVLAGRSNIRIITLGGWFLGSHGIQLTVVYERENSMRNSFLWLGVVALMVSSLGCGAKSEDVNPVTGKITYDGKPLVDARIRLQATNAGASRVYACDSTADGSFAIEAVYADGTKQGAPVGKYKVLVGKFEKTAAPETSDPDADEAMELEMVEGMQEGEDPTESMTAKTQINEKFNNSSTTPLELEVVAGENTFTIDLKADGTGTVK